MASPDRGSDIAFFVALIATSLMLGAGLAHAFALPNKLALDTAAYLVAQRAYDNWQFVGLVLPVQVTGIIVVIARHRRERAVLWPAGFALLFCLLAQAVFWIWTFPANQATQNWTQAPADFQTLRAQWEYSHFAGAVCQFLAMAALVLAVLRRRFTATGR